MKYTFAKINKYPTTRSGKIQWLSDKDRAKKLAKDFGATRLITCDNRGVFLMEEKITK